MTSLAPFVMMLLMFGASAAWMLLRFRTSGAAAAAQWSAYTVGALASRLGLRVVSGALEDNLMVPPTQLFGGLRDGEKYERTIRLEGAPRGRTVEILDHHRRELERLGLLSRTLEQRTWHQMHIGVQLRWEMPELEIISQRSSLGMMQRELVVPLVRASDPALDREFVFASREPRLLAAIAPMLSTLDPALRGYGVHLVCSRGWLRLVCDRNHVSGTMYFVDALVPFLEQMADRLEAAAWEERRSA